MKAGLNKAIIRLLGAYWFLLCSMIKQYFFSKSNGKLFMTKRNHMFCKICCFCILDFVLFFQLLTKLGKPWKILKPKQNVWTSLKKLELKRTTWYTVKSILFMQSLDAFIFPRALLFLELCLVGTYGYSFFVHCIVLTNKSSKHLYRRAAIIRINLERTLSGLSIWQNFQIFGKKL